MWRLNANGSRNPRTHGQVFGSWFVNIMSPALTNAQFHQGSLSKTMLYLNMFAKWAQCRALWRKNVQPGDMPLCYHGSPRFCVESFSEICPLQVRSKLNKESLATMHNVERLRTSTTTASIDFHAYCEIAVSPSTGESFSTLRSNRTKLINELILLILPRMGANWRLGQPCSRTFPQAATSPSEKWQVKFTAISHRASIKDEATHPVIHRDYC